MGLFRRAGQDSYGAVTIIVSIMLIPALLLSGTAVDVARIHAARSIVQNANQLVGNAALTQYDALLKDLYGLFGVAEEDQILAEMVNEYIQVAVFGEDAGEAGDQGWIDTGLGTFQHFHGSTASGKITPVYNLRKREVLRRQIEEYMKFRGPVILVERLLDMLFSQGGGLKASNEAVEQQQRVDQSMGELFKRYEALYEAIKKANRCTEPGGIPWQAVESVSDQFRQMKTAFGANNAAGELRARYARWDSVKGHLDAQPASPATEKEIDTKARYEAELAEAEKYYKAKLAHIVALAKGGSWMDWKMGRSIEKRDAANNIEKYDDGSTKYEWSPGDEFVGGDPLGLKRPGGSGVISLAKTHADEFKAVFSEVVAAATSIDSQREQARADIAALQQKIDHPDCDPTLRGKLQEQINVCTNLLDKYPNIAQNMAQPFKTAGDGYIDGVKSMLDGAIYREAKSGLEHRNDTDKTSLTVDQLSQLLSNISGNGFALDGNVHPDNSKARYFADFGEVGYRLPGGFKLFQDASFGPNNQALYNELNQMAQGGNFDPISIDGIEEDLDSTGEDGGTRQRNIIEKLIKLAEDTKDGLVNNPQGARKIVDATVANGTMGSPDIVGQVIDLISDPGNTMQDMVDWILLMTYDISMFSNYTTRKPEQLKEGSEVIDTPYEVSVANVTIDPRVNYFYQSEWEYLLNGNKDAGANLNAVKNLIYAIRLICNIITSFTVEMINTIGSNIQLLVSSIPFVGFALGLLLNFLVHTAFAAVESTIDLVKLRGGHKVEILKIGDSKWICALGEGAVKELEKFASSGDTVELKDDHDKEPGVSYEQYMLIFFLITSNIDTLLTRTANLIEWNVINHKTQANASNLNDKKILTQAKSADAESAMSAAFAQDDCFRLVKRHTDFDVTTTMNLKLLFLTMPVFQNQGSPFSGELEIVATDFRGY